MKIRYSLLLAALLLAVATPALLPHHHQSASKAHDEIANVAQSVNVSNLEASNWVLGSLTFEQYQAKRFLIASKYNTSLCPVATPFVLKGTTACARCPDNSFFSLDNETCISCPKGQVYNTDTNNCDSPASYNFTYITNLDSENWVLGNLTTDQFNEKRFAITSTHNVTQCPLSTPFVLSGKKICEQCPKQSPIFCLQNDTCIGCPKGETYNESSKQCSSTSPKAETVKVVNITNLEAPNWILGNMTIDEYNQRRFNITKNYNTTQCNITTPYVIDGALGACEQCPPDRPIFVLQNSTCISCENGSAWKQENKTCAKEEAKVNTPQPASNTTAPEPAKNTTAPTKVTATPEPTPNTTTPNTTTPSKVTEPTPTPNTTTSQPSKTTELPPPRNTSDVPKIGSATPTNSSQKVSLAEPFVDIDFCDEYEQCSVGQYFSYQDGACKFCERGQYFDADSQTCLFCGDQTPYLDESYKCQSCPRGTRINRVANKCL